MSNWGCGGDGGLDVALFSFLDEDSFMTRSTRDGPQFRIKIRLKFSV